jgi:chromosome segregation ATPase
MHAD